MNQAQIVFGEYPFCEEHDDSSEVDNSSEVEDNSEYFD